MAEICDKKWSGKEDSNLRPLPPENGSPASTWHFLVGVWRTRAAHYAVCSYGVHGRSHLANLRPLSCLSLMRERG
jgi:hypothetical protein